MANPAETYRKKIAAQPASLSRAEDPYFSDPNFFQNPDIQTTHYEASPYLQPTREPIQEKNVNFGLGDLFRNVQEGVSGLIPKIMDRFSDEPDMQVGILTSPEGSLVGTTEELVDQVDWDALGGRKAIEKALVDAWTKLELTGRPLISSGVRTLERQLAQGITNTRSRHLFGRAFDVFTGDMSAEDKEKLKAELKNSLPKKADGTNHYILIENDHIHIADTPGAEEHEALAKR
tara:strand:+ start:559 stop:1257 length:699 start_codon:yes stop_codon:yes gene_type:complete